MYVIGCCFQGSLQVLLPHSGVDLSFSLDLNNVSFLLCFISPFSKNIKAFKKIFSTFSARATSPRWGRVPADNLLPSTPHLQMWRPGSFSGVPSRHGEAAGLCGRGPWHSRQGAQRDGLLAGAHGPASLQEATPQDFGAERFAAALQRDLSLLAPRAVRPADVGHQVSTVRSRRQDVTWAHDGREGAAFRRDGRRRRDDGDDAGSGASQ